MRRSSLAALVSASLVLAAASSASAFCRTSSCPTGGDNYVTSQVCTPAQASDCGKPLYWPNPCTEWSLAKAASNQVSFAVMEGILKQAFATWTNAACSAGTPSIVVTEGEPTDCTKHEYNQELGNANLIAFRDTMWPYEGSANTLALTTVTYALESGEIYDADMELNSADNQFTTGDNGVQFDLLSIVTHEAGHFLGLAHTPDPTATMYPNYIPHSTNLRHLAADDIGGICAIYPPGGTDPSCDPTPRHGYSALCAADQPAGSGTTAGTGCACAAAGTTTGGWAAALAIAALAFAARRRPRR
jgi:MYXO-CTERM domain-containing protein